MKGAGVNNTTSFIVKETAPILDVKSGKVEESSRKLLRGTIVKGMLKTRIVNMDGQKTPYRFIQLDDKKGYISPRVVNIYIGNFANLDGMSLKDSTPVKSTSFGEKSTRKNKAKNLIINYGLPIAGAVTGYQIAKKMGADQNKTIAYTAFFGLIGMIPRYIYKHK
jgi:hypothetical protein